MEGQPKCKDRWEGMEYEQQVDLMRSYRRRNRDVRKSIIDFML
jgi:hypothetical protein